MFRFPRKKNDLENFWLSSRVPALALSCRPHGTWSAQSGTDTSWQQCHGTFSGWSRSWDGALGVGGSSDKMIPWRGRVRNPRKILVHQIEGVTLISLQIIEMFGVGPSKFWKMEFFLVFFSCTSESGNPVEISTTGAGRAAKADTRGIGIAQHSHLTATRFFVLES